MPRPSLIAWLALGTLVGCAAPAWTWSGLREDPDPSGAQYLRRYKEAFYQSLGDEFDEAWTEAQFLEHIQSARVLFLGDHHTDSALHRRQLALLDTLRAAGIQLVFGLESIGEQDRPVLRQYLMGTMDMDRLIARIESRWPGSWLSSNQLDSSFYRAVIRRARAWQTPTFALEPVPRLPLNLRDPLIAENIRLASERHPDRLIVCIVGHAHLLGRGRLLERVGYPAVATGARLSRSLAERWSARRFTDRESAVVLSESGVAFFPELLD